MLKQESQLSLQGFFEVAIGITIRRVKTNDNLDTKL
jgi:hypothetical protein